MAEARTNHGERGAERSGGAAQWVAAAFDALAEGGIALVRVELLARRLKLTKGSFYWHFADRPALLAAMAAEWRDGRAASIREQAGSAELPPAARLEHLLDLYLGGGNPKGLRIELAMRDWARHDANATKAVASVDAARLEAVGALYEAMGLAPREARARAHLFYAFIFGRSLIVGGRPEDAALCRAVLLGADIKKN
jgi:AcrR family transcriptional regulator